MEYLELINDNKWDEVYKLLQDKNIDVNKPINNGNTIFHLICIKGNINIIKKILENKHNVKINLCNDDGLMGQHLYYKYGGLDPIFINNKEVCYSDENDMLIFQYVIDKIDLLEKIIENMEHNNCIENIAIIDEYIYIELCTFINTSEYSQRYLDIIEKIYKKIKPYNLTFYAIETNCIKVIKLLITYDIDFDIYSQQNISAVALCIIYNRTEILINILEYTKHKYGYDKVFNIINNSDIAYNYRPLFIAFHTTYMTDILMEYMMLYINNNTSYIFDAIDEQQNTYLHFVLNANLTKYISFFIKHTDLNKENYKKITPAQLLFSKNLWIKYKSDLIGRKIDLLKQDNNNKNCYSYILPEHKKDFLELTQQIEIPIILKNSIVHKRLFNKSDIQNFLKTSYCINYNNVYKNINTFKTFYASLSYNMLYLKYLEKKHKLLYIPTQPYNKHTVLLDKYFFDILSYDISPNHKIVNHQLKQYYETYYSYIPYQIYWIDDDNYFIHPNLINILTEHNRTVSIDTQRYIMLKITIIFTNGMHANVLLYDRMLKTAWHFEPYGISKINANISLEKNLKLLLQTIYGNISYNTPSNYLHGLNFQMIDGEDNYINKNSNDPDGYCAAWSVWFIDIVLSYPHIDVRHIMTYFFDAYDINEILSEEEGEEIQIPNYYLEFIRKYAHKLDNEKNLLLLSIGIKKHNLYNNIVFDNNKNIIKKLFRENSPL